MRVVTVIVATFLFGAALGSVVAVLAYVTGEEIPYKLASGGSSATSEILNKPAARAEIPETDFKFGRMRSGEHGSHEFVVKNTGNAPLTLRISGTSCQCTLGVSSEEPVPPGESTTVKMEWHADGPPGQFRQTATLLTNDPLKAQVYLYITGEISDGVSFIPREFHFDRISSAETESAQVLVLSSLEDDFQVERSELIPAEKSEFFDVRFEPVPKEDLPDADAKAGLRVTLTSKPGLPVGGLNQRLLLHTNLPDTPPIEIPVTGRVTGEISVHGPEFDEVRGVLQLGSVKSAAGKSARLNVVVRGPNAAGVKLQIRSQDPKDLKVTIGEPVGLSDKLAHFPIEVAVPSGTPAMVRLGTAQGREGRIVLSTTHPSVTEVTIGVRFSVER